MAHNCARREPTNAFGRTRWRTCSMSFTGSHGSTKRTTMPCPRNPRIVAYNNGSGGDKTKTVSPVLSPSAEARDWAPAARELRSPNEAQPSFRVQIAGEVGRSRTWLATRFVQFIRYSACRFGFVLRLWCPSSGAIKTFSHYLGASHAIPFITYFIKPIKYGF